MTMLLEFLERHRACHLFRSSHLKSPFIFQSLKKQDNLMRKISEKKEIILHEEA